MSVTIDKDLYDKKREPETQAGSEKNKMTDWEKEPKFKDLYQNYVDAQQDHATIVSILEERKVNMDGGPVINAPKGKSTARPKLIRKQAEWKYPALEEPFLNSEDMFEVSPRSFEDVDAAEQNQLVLNYQWNVQIDKTEFVNDVVRTIYDDGTCIVKVGWEADEEEIMVEEEVPKYASPEESMMIIEQAVQSGQMSQEQAQQILLSGQPIPVGTETIEVPKTVLIKNQPTYEVCDTRNVILDPTSNGNVKDLQFIIHEYDTTMSDLKQEEYRKETVVNPETGEKETVEYGIYKNLDQIKVDDSDAGREYYNDVEINETTFKFNDEPRKKVRAYEYWGYWDIDGDGETEVIVATWVNKVLIRMEKSPFPFEGLPFAMSKYLPRIGQLYGETDGDLLVENQQSIGRMKRAAYDITADIAVGQEFIDEQFFASPAQRDNYRSGKTVYFRHGMDPKTSIYKSKIESVPNAVFDMINIENSDAESLTGTKAFSQGISSQAFGSVATGIRSALDATSKRELSILRRISNQIFVDIGKKTIAMNQMFLDEKTVVRLTNKEFVTIKLEDLAGDFDLKLSISTPEKDNEKAEKLNMMMQTNAASMNPDMAKIIYAKMAKLWNLPDLAEAVLTYEPKPDPVQEEIKQLELENARLTNKKLNMEVARIAKDIESENSKIVERNSRTAQNINSESEENIATARLKNAQAKKLEEEADITSLKFLRMKDGTERREKLEDKEMDHLSKMQQNQLKEGSKKELEQEKMQHDIDKEYIDTETDIEKNAAKTEHDMLKAEYENMLQPTQQPNQI